MTMTDDSTEIRMGEAESDAGTAPASAVHTASPKRMRSRVDTQRAQFLRRCRARIKPSDIGLPSTKRKRTEGLRREDVAALSGVSASWYTWLEQGRDMRVSDEVLERVCRALRLSQDERTYLFSLVQRRPPRVQHDMVCEEAPPDVARMINALHTPAIAMNLRWDVLAWNAINSVIFRDYSLIPRAERNLLEILFSNPPAYLTSEEFECMAHRLVARLHFDYSRCADDPRFEELVQRLCARFPLFSRLWSAPDFNLRAYGLHRFTHPRFGELVFEHSSYVPDGHPHIRVVICTPDNAAAREAVAQVIAELAQR
jgi:transcriptional regulator with XRE-family HTH domain